MYNLDECPPLEGKYSWKKRRREPVTYPLPSTLQRPGLRNQMSKDRRTEMKGQIAEEGKPGEQFWRVA